MKLSACCLLLLLAASAAMAQPKRMLYTAKGEYLPGPAKLHPTNAKYHGFTDVQMNAMRMNMHNFMELIRKTPCLNPPKGYEVKVYAMVCSNGSCGVNTTTTGKKMMAGECDLLMREYTYTKTNPAPERAVEGPSIKVWFNDLSSWLNRGVYNEGGFQERAVVDEIAGCPVLEGGYLVITKNKKPLFVYVTKEDGLKMHIKELEEDIKKIKENQTSGSAYQQWMKTKDASLKDIKEGLDLYAQTNPEEAKVKWEKTKEYFAKQEQDLKKNEAKELEEHRKYLDGFIQRLQGFRDQLATMSTAEKNQPAINGAERKVIRPNPDFWDATKKPTDLQLVVIDLFHYDKDKYGYAHDLIREIRKTINIAELAASIK
ncbi:MAG: hypothetical protein ACTHMC_18150 [Pseudobacter sp.]|uniref:hypothetical protein n=1 Tax=Pseudobacter sp. TaxID=2045420 RepID=UPI003F7DA25D